MANKSLKDLQGLFWAVLTKIVNNDEVQIRRSWQTEGAPDWRITDNVLFIQVHEEAGDDITQLFDRYLEEKEEDFVEHAAFTRVIRLNIIGYGDAAYFYMQKIRHGLYSGVKELRKEKIYLIPEPDSIQSVPELFQGRWWPRADMDIKFNNLVTFETDVNAVKEVNVSVNLNHSGPSDVVTVDSLHIIVNK